MSIKKVHLNPAWQYMVLPAATFPLRTLCGRHEWPPYNTGEVRRMTCLNCKAVLFGKGVH